MVIVLWFGFNSECGNRVRVCVRNGVVVWLFNSDCGTRVGIMRLKKNT